MAVRVGLQKQSMHFSMGRMRMQVCKKQVPLRLEHSSDESGHVTSRLREWKRRDWGEGGDDFAWWCTEEATAFVGSEPLYLSRDDATPIDLIATTTNHRTSPPDRPRARPRAAY